LIEIGTPIPIASFREIVFVLKRFLPYSAPLILATGFLWLTRSIDRFLIVQLLGLASVSIYGVAFQVASLLFFVLGPINFVLFPRVSECWGRGDKDEVNRYFSQGLTLTLILGAPVIAGIFLTSGGVIKILAGQTYISGQGLMLLLLLSCLASMVYQNHLYVIHLVEKTYLLPILFISTSLLNLTLGYFLVSKTGLIGAAVSRTLTLVIMAAIVTIWARHYVRFQVSWFLLARVLIASLIMTAAIYWMPMDTIEDLMMKIASGVMVFTLCLILLRVTNKENFILLRRQFSTSL
jgi:O-antigen/teichoic acid export membrane protein